MQTEFDKKLRDIFKTVSDSEILLVVPPFSATDLPCIGVDILKTIAEKEGVKTSVLYANMIFAEYIGKEKYQHISRALMSMHTMLGERIFCDIAYDSMPVLGENFLVRYDENFNENFIELSSLEEMINIAEKAREWTNIVASEIVKSNHKIVGITTGHQQTNAAVALINAIKNIDSSILCTMGGSACDGEMAKGIESIALIIYFQEKVK